MAPAHINPAVLRWALVRASETPAAVATSMKKDTSDVVAWLTGQDAPTFKQAQTLAKKLRLPFGYLFLAEPPADELPLTDFRRGPSGAVVPPSVDLKDVVADVLRRQDWYRDHVVDQDDDPLDFVGSVTMEDPPADVAQSIRTKLDFEEKVRIHSQSVDFLRAFVQQCEVIGVLVMRNGKVSQNTSRKLSVDEFRGFAISDVYAPVIFVNLVDAPAAQAFTLAHELAHIWLGASGISNADPSRVEFDDPTEQFCNDVAGEVLVPWAKAGASWDSKTSDADQWIREAAQRYHVSTVMVARQLWGHGVIERQDFFDFYTQESAKWVRTKGKSSGGNYYLSAPIRNSRRLTQAVLDSVAAFETTPRDASHLLGVSPANLPELHKRMEGE